MKLPEKSKLWKQAGYIVRYRGRHWVKPDGQPWASLRSLDGGKYLPVIPTKAIALYKRR